MENWMQVSSMAIWDETKQAWRVHTEYTASNFQSDEPLVKEHYISMGDEGVLPCAVTDTIGLVCNLAEGEWMEEIT